MHLALIAEHFPPVRSSCAVQMRDLATELVRQGHQVTVLVPDPSLQCGFALEDCSGVEVVRLKTLDNRRNSYAMRTAAEFLMPFAMLRNLRASPAAGHRYDGIAWYSPNIFFGPLVRALKRQSRCRSYLILRDIFPQWAADIGLIRRGLAFRMLSQVADYQYRSADLIGVQTPGNLAFCEDSPGCAGAHVEVLQNWLGPQVDEGCSINLDDTPLRGRKIFVYAGNMGVAQSMDRLLRLPVAFNEDPSLGFVFVGRGSEADRLRQSAERQKLTNTLFFGAIDPNEIPGLYAQCHVGLVALDPRHLTHNIPGKFITYMHAGLPVLAAINRTNDLVELVRNRGVGKVSTDPEGSDLPRLARELIAQNLEDPATSERCRNLARHLFSVEAAAAQIVAGLSGSQKREAAASASGLPW